MSSGGPVQGYGSVGARRNDVEGRERQSLRRSPGEVRTEESQLSNDRQEMSVSGVRPVARGLEEERGEGWKL